MYDGLIEVNNHSCVHVQDFNLYFSLERHLAADISSRSGNSLLSQ